MPDAIWKRADGGCRAGLGISKKTFQFFYDTMVYQTSPLKPETPTFLFFWDTLVSQNFPLKFFSIL